VSLAFGLLAFCPALRAVAYSTCAAGGGGIEMTVVSASTNELPSGAAVPVPLGGALFTDAEPVVRKKTDQFGFGLWVGTWRRHGVLKCGRRRTTAYGTHGRANAEP